MGRRGENSGAAWLRPRYARPGGPPSTTLTRRGLLAFLGLGGLMTVPDFPDEKAPDAHATAISLTGAPPLVLKNILDLLLSTTLPANGTITRPASGLFTLNQPGYEILVSLATTGSPVPIVSVELQWIESFTGFTLDSEIYYMYSGNAAGHLIHGRGPTKADRVKVIFKNLSSGVSTGVNYVLLQTSRTFTREFWRTVAPGGVQPVYTGFTAANSDMGANLLSGDTRTLAGLTAASMILPLYTGTVRLYGTTTDTTPANSQWLFKSSASALLPAATIIQAVAGVTGFAPFGASSVYLADVPLPRAQCQLTLQNTNTTTSETLTANIVAREDRA